MKVKLAVLLLLAGQSVFAQQVKTHIYKVAEGKELALDVYSSSGGKSEAAKPVIIFFHGGGLVTGNRNSLKNHCVFFAEKGLVAVTASYRLLPKNDPKANDSVSKCIEDAKSAVHWVKLNAAELNIDTNTVILGGGSAGGFLAAQATLNKKINSSDDPLFMPTKARALILYNPAFTPTNRYGPDVLLFVDKHTPPSIVFYGDKDRFKPGGMKYLEKLNTYHVQTDYWIAGNEGHGYYNKPEWESLTSQLAYNFLVEAKVIKGPLISIANNTYTKKATVKP